MSFFKQNSLIGLLKDFVSAGGSISFKVKELVVLFRILLYFFSGLET